MHRPCRLAPRFTSASPRARRGHLREGLERNPGSRPLADRGWRPLWFEARVTVDGDHEAEHHHSLIWAEAGRDVQAVAEEELALAVDEALRNLPDMEGLEVWPEHVTQQRLRVDARP